MYLFKPITLTQHRIAMLRENLFMTLAPGLTLTFYFKPNFGIECTWSVFQVFISVQAMDNNRISIQVSHTNFEA